MDLNVCQKINNLNQLKRTKLSNAIASIYVVNKYTCIQHKQYMQVISDHLTAQSRGSNHFP